MKKTDIRKIYLSLDEFSDKEVVLAGWVRSVRDLKNFCFIDLNDGTSFKGAQIVFNSDKDGYSEVAKLNAGSSIICTGKIVLTPNSKQPFEMQCNSIQIECKTDETYPLQKKGHSFEFLREQAYLRPRSNLFNAVFRVRSEASFALHQFFNNEGFVYLQAPILTSSDCEGAGELFKVSTQDIYSGKKLNPEDELFGKSVFLSPSCQLEGEAFALGLGNIYTFGPSFRAENSNTVKHANEFWHIEPEMAFAELFDDMDVMERMIKYVINYLFEKCENELKFFDSFVEKGLIDKLKNVTNNDFARVTYTEAIETLKKNNDKFEFKAEWGCDLQSEHEKYLAQVVYGKPVFVYNYPKEIKAFYMRLNEDNKTVKATDLLVPGIGELCGASEREERYDVLLNRIHELGLNEEDYWWYLNLRKFGSVKHSGFGMGFDRFIMYVTGMTNIRDVLPFPRTPKNCSF
ncbi:MAG: asparagine--tRNA ligase [Clostridiales bacterium]|nr:asparagine--tRNA ligase [Clostridiales bacterium]